MIGTDIIDLIEARVKSDWRRKGYLTKLFSKDEIHYIEQASDPDLTVWRLWSMKESAYKADFHKTGLRKFNPVEFSCDIQGLELGVVRIDSRSYKTVTKATDQYVLSWTEQDNIKSSCKSIRTGSMGFVRISELLYSRLERDIAASLEKDSEMVKIHKTKEGVPEVYLQGSKFNIYCSISHHGVYGSILFCY